MNRISTTLAGVFMALLGAIAAAEDQDMLTNCPMDMMGGGMGRGMMGGHGYGPGMMGGYGMGSGMMGGHAPFAMLNLSDDQRSKIIKIHDDERKQHWAIMGKMLDKQSSLRDLLAQSEPDPKKVGAAYAEMAKLRQQMLEIHVQANNDMQKLLTREQREQLQQWQRGMPGGGGPRGMMGR